MSEDDELDRAVGDLFDRYFRYDQTLHDSKVLDALLPDNSTVVRSLGERCLDEARKRLRRTSYRGTASRDYRAATAKAGPTDFDPRISMGRARTSARALRACRSQLGAAL
jgi:hypothetical protein